MIKKNKQLNNKGLTAIEVLVCFSIVAVIVMSMFKVINNQKDKQTIESYKNSVITYKNSVTKTIEEDIRLGGGINILNDINDAVDTYVISFTLAKTNENSTSNQRTIKIEKKLDCDEDSETSTIINCDEKNEIQYYYGDLSSSQKDNFPIPNIYNLKFNKIDVSSDSGYLKIYVGFDHPDLGKKYSAFELIDPISATYF